MAGPMPRVVKQEQSKEWHKDGTPHRKWTVTLEHENGTTGEVELPDEHYSAENVAALAQHQADVVHEVGQIGNT